MKNVLEVGCGLGYYTNFLATECSDTKITGMDVSETAIQKAREKWSQLSFLRGNIKDQNDVWEDGLYDAVLFAEILWYVLEDIEEIKIKANKFLSSGGVLLVNQVFYNGQQQYGKEYFTNQDEMIRFFGWNVLARSCAYMEDI